MKNLLSIEKMSREEMEHILAATVAMKQQRGLPAAGRQNLGLAVLQVLHPHAGLL